MLEKPRKWILRWRHSYSVSKFIENTKWNTSKCSKSKFFYILACCSAAISGQINCTDKSDGAYGSGCRSYTKCEGGIGTLIDCLLNEEAFNYLTGKCQPWAFKSGKLIQLMFNAFDSLSEKGLRTFLCPAVHRKMIAIKKMMESTLYFQSAPISTPAPITNSSEQTHATTLPMETVSEPCLLCRLT